MNGIIGADVKLLPIPVAMQSFSVRVINWTAFTLLQFPNQYSHPPWTSYAYIPDALHVAGDNCTFFGCYKYLFKPTHQTVVKAFPETTCVIGKL